MTQVELPQELLEQILLLIKDDLPSLWSSALVCRAFYAPSQRLLFRSIHLKHNHEPSAPSDPAFLVSQPPMIGPQFQETVRNAPHLKSYIKELAITAPTILPGDPFIEQVSSLLPTFPSLSSLAIRLSGSVGCSLLLQAVGKALRTRDVPLDTLDVMSRSGVHRDFLRVLEDTGIRRFSLSEIGISWVGIRPENALCLCKTIPSLTELTISLSREPFEALVDLFPLRPIFPQLLQFTAIIGAMDEFNVVTRMVGTPEMFPLSLDIILCITVEATDLDVTTGPDVMPLLNLQHVPATHLILVNNTVHVRRDEVVNHISSCLDWWIENFTVLSPGSRVRKVTLRFESGFDNDQDISDAFRRLDTVLAQSSIQEVILERLLHDSMSSDGGNDIREGFPHLAKKGVLRTWCDGLYCETSIISDLTAVWGI